MDYRLIYTKSAINDIQKLDLIAKKRLKKKLALLASNPLHYAKKLVHHDLGDYRYRVGNYRVIFDLDRNHIVILRVGHRREIYR
ncbi:hypothetical protein A3B57_00035 [Microgenomates group bacterium RIFCSPLOWO2_01_FULL_47_10]|nr:MAG: hypothetical protein A3B57_00035 [Microgenomates group bacterium RIFCSPLOWO2_01_FULL_47_10]